jgi:ribosomal protein S27E
MPWINAKYDAECAECGHDIAEGDRVLYDPLERRMYCETCGFDVVDPED